MPQNCQSPQKQGKSKKLSQPRGAKETSLQNLMWYPGWDPRTENRH